MIVQDEQLGTKDKFWCQFPREEGDPVVSCEPAVQWLFKQPRQEPGKAEHLAEKIAREAAVILGVPCAEVELADFNGVRGSVSRRMTAPDTPLAHGNEVLAGQVPGYDAYGQRRTSDHTWERIQQAILSVCAQADGEADLRQFAGYLVLDALVANTDRHHENWGLLRRERPHGTPEYRLAPSFDHASSLGREIRDDRRQRLVAEGAGRIEHYLRGGEGGVYLEADGGRPVAPIVLVERLAPLRPGLFAPWLEGVAQVTDEAIRDIVERFPAGWFTRPQSELATAILQASRELLQRVRSRL